MLRIFMTRRHIINILSLQQKVIFSVAYTRRKIRSMEGNAKCIHLKNRPVKGLCGSCLSVWGPEPPYTLYTCIQYTYSIREGGTGGELYDSLF
jgi:hypothetical protein